MNRSRLLLSVPIGVGLLRYLLVWSAVGYLLLTMLARGRRQSAAR